MSIYDINGNALAVVYDKNGNNCPVSYDKNGDVVFASANYVRHADGTIEPVTVSPSIGQVTKLQSFLVYDDSFYSTDGSSIALQDSDFSYLRTVYLTVGHGNSFQLGDDGYGYISGWDDQSVYVIDLDTVSILNTITLPTTGYTTGSVDTANGYIYIFQRDTLPSTESLYNFIKYDYINDSVVFAKVTDKQFAALQSCDFYDGKIYITYGKGTDVAPCGLDIYDTNGTLLSEYSLEIFANKETEGLFVERNTGDILLSLVDRKVYRIS